MLWFLFWKIQMFDFEESNPNILSISALDAYIKELFESDEITRDVWVKGEISKTTRAKSGHLYLSLKDSDAQFDCVMWSDKSKYLLFEPRVGMNVEAQGSVNIYTKEGKVQLYINKMREAGEGALYAEFLRLKAKLDSEGLFDSAHKKAIPDFPKHIGIVTSISGAAIQDILNTLERRLPTAKITVAPSLVQGDEAPASLIRGLKALDRISDIDLILLARGGGSPQDLACFNDEDLAFAIFNTKKPVISGVGHEIDFSIADFVADLRAPTPTAAAELASPKTMRSMLNDLYNSSNLLSQLLSTNLNTLNHQLRYSQSALERFSPRHRLNTAMQHLDQTTSQLDRSINNRLNKLELNLERENASLSALNPKAVLKRGYAIVSEALSRKTISHIAQVEPHLPIKIQVSDGSFFAEVTDIKKEE